MNKIIGIASDHAGYAMKSFLVDWFKQEGYEVVDYGTDSEASADYADYGHALARGIECGEVERGVALCGSGEGISMTLNKHQSIRAGLSWCEEIAKLTRQHNNSNVVVLPARFITEQQAIAIVTTWLETPFEGGRHQLRIDKIPL